jgi:hypothetical protein
MSLCCPPSQLPHPFYAFSPHWHSALCTPSSPFFFPSSLSTLLIPCVPFCAPLPFTLTVVVPDTPLPSLPPQPLLTLVHTVLAWHPSDPISILATLTAQTTALPLSYHLTTSDPTLSSPPTLCQPFRLPLPCWFYPSIPAQTPLSTHSGLFRLIEPLSAPSRCLSHLTPSLAFCTPWMHTSLPCSCHVGTSDPTSCSSFCLAELDPPLPHAHVILLNPHEPSSLSCTHALSPSDLALGHSSPSPVHSEPFRPSLGLAL